MPAQEVQQPQAQQMEIPSQDASRVNAEQPVSQASVQDCPFPFLY